MANIIVVEDLAAPATIGRGGQTMYLLQWLHGLERLGHCVLFIEFLKEDPGMAKRSMLRYFSETVTTWWHADQAALIVETPTNSLYGLEAERVTRFANEAAAVITLSAHYRRDPYPLIEKVRPRILIESDPGYTHLWAADGAPEEIYGDHDSYFTIGGNIGSPRCSLPTLDINWRPVWHPVVLDWWSSETQVIRDHFTTISDWRGYGYLEFEGKISGPKAEEFRKFVDLPNLVGETLEIVSNIDPEDSDVGYFQDRGWTFENPRVVSSPALFRDYIASSFAEFSCAKGGYVGTHCGWFGDRGADYLAAGRPVVLQETGFGDLLPTGKGLFSVKTVEEAAEAIRAIRSDYALHSAAAREIAREHFDSDKIVRRVLAEAAIGGHHR